VSWTEDDYRALMRGRFQALATVNAPKPSKYRNVKTVADGQTFDSRREADYWLLLKSREQLGEIANLRRQVRFELCCPDQSAPNLSTVVAYFVADFVYETYNIVTDKNVMHVLDAKGMRTQIYKLKAKWMMLQHGIMVQEV
jgi:hypothetical protein